MHIKIPHNFKGRIEKSKKKKKKKNQKEYQKLISILQIKASFLLGNKQSWLAAAF